MGSCCSSGDKSDRQSENGDQRQQQQQQPHPCSYNVPGSAHKKKRPTTTTATDHKQTLSAMSSFNSSKGVGLGISMMMYQAGMLAGCTAPSSVGDLNNLRDQIRKAKAEGRTVTVMNGCVYIDYQLKAQIPPGFNLES